MDCSSSSSRPFPTPAPHSKSAAISSKCCKSRITRSRPCACSRRRTEDGKIRLYRKCRAQRLPDASGDEHFKPSERFARRVVARDQRLREPLLVRLAQALLSVRHGTQLAGETQLAEGNERARQRLIFQARGQ